MSKNNQHIKEFLDYYVKLSFPPEYAVLIKGEWGAGKTYFIKEYFDKKEEVKSFHISLYGVTSYKDIQRRIFQAIYPKISNKWARGTGKVLKSLVKRGLKIDVSDINIIDYFPLSEGSIFIFDDLERCALSIKETLGYINHFVEYEEQKVILLANEEQIDQQDAYRNIKEKVIGKTFHVVPQFNHTLSMFLEKHKPIEAISVIEKSFNEINDLFNKSEINNLRILNQSLLDFCRLYSRLESYSKDNQKLMSHLLKEFLILSFGSKIGSLSTKYISQIETLSIRFSSLSDGKNDEVINIAHNYIKKFDINEWILNGKVWREIIENSHIDGSLVNEILRTSSYFPNNTPLWRKATEIWHQTDKELEENLRLLRKELNDRKIKTPGILLHVYGLFLFLADEGLIADKKEDLLNEGKEYVGYLKNTGNLLIRGEESSILRTYAGVSYIGNTVDQFKGLKKFLYETIDQVKIQKLGDSGEKLLEAIKTDPDEFYRLVAATDPRMQNYCNLPVLHLINEEEFLKAVLMLPPNDQSTIFYSLHERYIRVSVDEIEFYKEMQWVERLASHIKEYLSSRVSK